MPPDEPKILKIILFDKNLQKIISKNIHSAKNDGESFTMNN
jgi:hypothetical protein